MIVLGIETSCDETSIAIIQNRTILSLKTHSQISIHNKYGGVVPEIASRSHIDVISEVTESCLIESKLTPSEIDLIAVTSTPGLIGGLLVGTEFAKGLSMYLNKPTLFINHLEGHIFTTSLTEDLEENFYCLLISGGHTQTIIVNDIDNYKLIGQTLDDSVGEGFDKISKALNLGYPGGPIIEKFAQKGDETSFKFNNNFIRTNKLDFSFSGLKTHFIRLIQKQQNIDEKFIQNISASFQKAVSDILLTRVQNMIHTNSEQSHKFRHLVVCGGVSANMYIRSKLNELCVQNGLKLVCAPLYLCTDNAAMIANVGRIKFSKLQSKDLN